MNIDVNIDVGVERLHDGETELVALSRQMCTRLGADLGWNADPVLAIVYHFQHGAPCGGHYGMLDVPIQTTFWGAFGPQQVIRGVADARALDVDRLRGESWRGFALWYNSYAFSHPDCARGCEHEQWMAAGRSIGDHPEAVEWRHVITFTRNGEVATAGHFRGGEIKSTEQRRDGDQAPRGTISDALWHLVDETHRRLAAARN